ncbi:protamine-like [Ostrinia furnacalis]|uniref:protamine-like n=1 Tax=Ostrinia furnacalis TaxID=93504 RepID=UPI00103883A3|nr:protamine-like [Ostrinia furnacalis]
MAKCRRRRKMCKTRCRSRSGRFKRCRSGDRRYPVRQRCCRARRSCGRRKRRRSGCRRRRGRIVVAAAARSSSSRADRPNFRTTDTDTQLLVLGENRCRSGDRRYPVRQRCCRARRSCGRRKRRRSGCRRRRGRYMWRCRSRSGSFKRCRRCDRRYKIRRRRSRSRS